MHRKPRVWPLLLALTLTLIPATPRAQTAEVEASKGQKAATYVACALGIVLAPCSPLGLACVIVTCSHAYFISQD